MGVTVEIRDSDNSIEGILEVQDSTAFPLSLTYGIADIKNATPTNNRWRGGSYSKDFSVAGSHANNLLLQHIYDTNIDDVKDMKALKPCVVKVDGIPYMNGNFKVIDITTSKGVRSYKCRVTGDNLVWVDQFNGLRLNELSWGSHTFDKTTIEASWTATNLDYYYPITNYGKWDVSGQVSVEDLRPGIFFKSIIDKAFLNVGYKVSSNFFDSAQFGELFRLFTGTGFKHPQSTLDTNQFTATKTTDQDVNFGSKAFNVDLGGTINPIEFESTDNAGVFNVSTDKFTAIEYAKYDFELSLNVKAVQSAPDNNYLQVRLNGSLIEEIEIFWINGTSTSTPGFSSVEDLIVKPTALTLQVGDEVTFAYRFEYTQIKSLANVEISMLTGTTLSNLMSPQFIRGVNVNLAQQLPDTEIIKYINGLTHCFNLVWKTNVSEKTVIVEPFDNWDDISDVNQDGFYKAISEANDFTQDLDIGKSYTVGFLSDYKREIRYEYKEDNKDDFLKKVNEAVEESYGSYKHTFSDRFKEGEQKSQNPTFAFTYYIKDTTVGTNSLTNQSPLLARLWKETKENGAVPEFDTDFEERIVYRNVDVQGSVQLNWEGSLISNIPTGLSFGDRTTDWDLKYNGQNGLVGTFYASQLNVIEKGIFVNAFFKFRESRIQQYENGDLSREPLYLSNPPELKGYYLINEIADVTPQNPNTYRFELIKYENRESAIIDTNQDDGIGNGPFGEESIYSPGLENSIKPDSIPVWAEITLSGTNTAILHVTMYDSDDNTIKAVTIPG